MTSDRYVDGTYLETVPDWHVGDSPWKAAQVLRMLEKNHLSPRSVYDVGCGAGQILVELQRALGQSVEFAGFDIASQAIAIAQPNENSRLKFYNTDFLSAAVPEADLLLLLDVFEHVPDYIGFLKALRERARWVVFHIPLDICAKTVLRKSCWMLYMRERYGHLHYFTKESALATISDAGFQIVDHFYTDDLQISPDMVPRGFRPRLLYEIRKNIYRLKPDVAVSMFESYNLMLLAHGNIN